MLDTIDRHVRAFAAHALDVFPVAVIQGARRVGKSTFATMLAAGRPHVWFTLDDEAARQQALDDPRTFATQGGDGLLVVDEIQRAPDLLLAIKAAVDRDPRPGRFLLTGSSDVLRMSSAPDSLAGRAVTIPLMGFSLGEANGRADDFAHQVRHRDTWVGHTSAWTRDQYADAICRGSYPEVRRLDDRDRRLWLTSYLDRVLRLDSRAVSRSMSAPRLTSILRLIAANQAGELVYARLADQLGISAPTVRDYVDALHTLFLTVSVPPWTANLTKREVGRPTVSVQDSGVAALMNRATASHLTALASAEHFGSLLEGLVTTELLKQRTWTSEPFEVFKFRDSDGIEVDIVLEFEDGAVYLIEVKSTQTPRSDSFTSMRKLAARVGSRFLGGAVLSTTPTSFRQDDTLWSLPVSALWDHTGSR